MISDRELKQKVEAELRWTPGFSESDIEVSVRNATVTLRGFARSRGAKHEAEEAVRRISGIAGVANDIEVRSPGSGGAGRR